MKHTDDKGKVLVLVAHPDLENSHANRALARAAAALPMTDVVNIYDEAMDAERYRIAVGEASAVVFQFPFWWGSAPYMLKRWCDEAFMSFYRTPGVVTGKPLMVATTTGSPYESYRSGGQIGYTMDELLRPYQLLADYSGMAWRTPFVIYGVGETASERDVQGGVEEYVSRLEMLVG